MNAERKRIIASNEVSRVESPLLGGYEQKIAFDGKHASNPVVIYLHGGPGHSFPFSVGSRGLFPLFTDHFLMVYWDQLGCGANYQVIDDSFTTSSFVEMTIDLIKVVKAEYPHNKLFIIGASWGSMLAARTALALPEMLDGVLTYGQIIKELAFNRFDRQALEQSSMPEKEKLRMRTIFNRGQHTDEDVKLILGWLGKYTTAQMMEGQKLPLASMLYDMLSSPDYSLKDVKAALVNGYTKNQSLMQELATLDLSETLEAIQVPYLILQGSADLVTPTPLVEEFMSQTANPNVRLKVIEGSSHIPNEHGMQQVLEEGKAFAGILAG